MHEQVYDAFVGRLKAAYGSVRVGDPREAGVLVGPLVDAAAYSGMRAALAEAAEVGGMITGGERMPVAGEGAFYVRPALVEIPDAAGSRTS